LSDYRILQWLSNHRQDFKIIYVEDLGKYSLIVEENYERFNCEVEFERANSKWVSLGKNLGLC